MKNKTVTVYISVLALVLACLFIFNLLPGLAGYNNLLMIKPSAFEGRGMDSQKLEEFSQEEFLLTYAVRQTATVQAINTVYSAALVGTNHNFAAVMGYLLQDGGFFTKSAMEHNSKHAVLNRTAAFQMFGSDKITGSVLKINGEAWIVTGVIEDGDTETASLYVPAGTLGGQAESVMALMDESVTEAYVKSALKSIGIHDNSYDFINLSKSAAAFSERFSVACKASLSMLILLFIFAAGEKLRKTLPLYRLRIREMYLAELIAFHRKDLLKAAFALLLLAAGITSVLALSLEILATCLAWRELTPINGDSAAGDFAQKLLPLKTYEAFHNALFWIYICLILLIPAIRSVTIEWQGGKRGERYAAMYPHRRG